MFFLTTPKFTALSKYKTVIDRIPVCPKLKNFVTKHLIKILFFVTWLIDPAAAQIIQHGTYFVARFTDNYAVVAIDSRQTINAERPAAERHPPDDRFCKIKRLARNAFFFSRGAETKINERTNEVLFDVREVARRVYIQFGIGTTKLDEVARAWGDQVEAFYSADPEAAKIAVSGIMNNGFFVGENTDGTINYAEEVIQLRSDSTFFDYPMRKQQLDQIPADYPTNANGHLDLLREFATDARTPRAQEALSKINNSLSGLDRIAAEYTVYVNAVREWSHDPLIGGEVASVILQHGHDLRWYHRPDFCPEN